MSGYVNKVILLGNVGRDPEIRTTGQGKRIANVSVATTESWKDRSTGERKERTEWHRVVIYNDNLVEVVEKYIKKGTKIYVEGSLQTRKWTDQAGVEKYSTEVVIQAYKGEINIVSGGVSRDDEGDDKKSVVAAQKRATADLDDEIPF